MRPLLSLLAGVLALAACSFEPINLPTGQPLPDGGDFAAIEGDTVVGDSVTGDGARGDTTAGDPRLDGDATGTVICAPLADGTHVGTEISVRGLSAVGRIGALQPTPQDTDVVALFHFDGSGTESIGSYFGDGPNEFEAVIVDPDSIGLAHFRGMLGDTVGVMGAIGFLGNDALWLTGSGIERSGPITVAVWVRADPGLSMSILGLEDDAGNLIWDFGLRNSSGHLNVALKTVDETCTTEAALQSIPEIDATGWFHVTATFEAGGDMALFVNGELAAQGIGRAPASVCSAPGTWRLGNGPLGGFVGSMDELVIYNRMLPAEEIRSLYERQSPELTGRFVSGACDVGTTALWEELAPAPRAPYGKSLPVASEGDYLEANVSTEGLVASWPFSGTGTLPPNSPIFDEVAGRPGSTRAQDVYYLPGRVQTALHTTYLNYLPGWVVLEENSDLLKGVSEFSLAFWYRQLRESQGPATLFAVSKSGILEPRFTIEIEGASLTSSWSNQDVSGLPNDVTLVAFPLRNLEWTHVAVVGDFSAGTVTIYRNGAQPTMASATISGFPDTAASIVTLGRDVTETGGSIRGWFDELSVWHRALSPEEVEALYRRGARRVRYQVRACSTSDCAGTPFLGPGGDANRWFSEAGNRTAGIARYPLDAAAAMSTRYFQYQIYFDSLDTTSPAVQSIGVSATAQ